MVAGLPISKSAQPVDRASTTTALPEFSLVAGGPLFRLFCRAHLADAELGHVGRRIWAIVLIAWLPLLILTIVEGHAWSGVKSSFFSDVATHLRLCLALPFLIAAEREAHELMRAVASHFIERGRVVASMRPRFEAAVKAAHRLRDSLYPELTLAVLLLTLGVAIDLQRVHVLADSTWYWPSPGSTGRLTAAGWWSVIVSVPIMQFLLFRWYFRLFIWAQFLWRVSRLEVKLAPTHPDRAGGLGFLGAATHGFWQVLFAQGAILAALMSRGILYGRTTFLQYKLEICLLPAVTLLWAVVPLVTFLPMLVHAKRAGKNAYSAMSQRYAVDFERKWMRDAPPPEPLLGSSDIQSLADLSNAYRVVKNLQVVPIGKEAVLTLVILSLLPVAPLALTLVPLDKIASGLLAAIF